MFGFKQSNLKSYSERIKEQINQYAKVENMHAQLPDIQFYWQKKHYHPRFRAVSGCENYLELYAKVFIDRIKRTGNKNIVSFGSGDGAIEVKLAKLMRTMGASDFQFDLVELSTIQHERARNNASNAGLAECFNMVEADFNTWRADKIYSGAMAHHALHHVVELEHLFKAIYDGLHDDCSKRSMMACMMTEHLLLSI